MPYIEYDEVEAACADCGRLFPSSEALEAHRTESHVAAEAVPGPKARIRCSVCQRSFRSVENLAEHNRRAHSG